MLTGQRIERKEIGSPAGFDHLSDDELERALIERLQLLGKPRRSTEQASD